MTVGKASNSRPRRRMRSSAEQMYWDQLSPSERFTIGYVVGQGIDFPSPAQIGALRIQLGFDPHPTPGRGRATGGSPLRGRPVARDADGRRFTYDLALVAAIARGAIAAGRSAADAVFEQIEHCSSPKAASVAITKARQAGHDIPYLRSPGRSAS